MALSENELKELSAVLSNKDDLFIIPKRIIEIIQEEINNNINNKKQWMINEIINSNLTKVDFIEYSESDKIEFINLIHENMKHTILTKIIS